MQIELLALTLFSLTASVQVCYLKIIEKSDYQALSLGKIHLSIMESLSVCVCVLRFS